jgi:hypothetical protein
MKMTIDAMDLLASGRVDGFGLMSSDSDFTPLVTRIRQDGIPVYGFGNANTPEGFRRACTRFIDVAALEPAEVPASKPARKAETRPAAAKSKAATESEPKAKPIDEEVVKLLIDAYDAVKRDEHGFAALGSVGQLAGNRSSFDTRNYGYKRLSDLIRDVPNFTVEVREGGQTWIKRVH